MEKFVNIVNEQGRRISSNPVPLDQAHRDGLRHPSVHVLVTDRYSRIYARQRPSEKSVYPNAWTSSVGDHVLHDELPTSVAQRGLVHFLGLTVALNELYQHGVHPINGQGEVETMHLYSYLLENPADIKLNNEQGQAGEWMAIDKIVRLEKVTPHLLAGAQFYLGNEYSNYE